MTLLVALLLSAEPTSHQVSIPLDDYEQLRRQSERPSLTVVDLLRVDGSFGKKDLSLTFSGRASGSWPTADVLSADGARLHSCEGEALLSRADSGAFAVTPLAPRFTLRCKLTLDGSDRLAAQTTRAVLEIASTVSDGELVSSGSGADRAFSVVRKISGAQQQDLPPSVTGRYLVSLLPDEARFLYRLEIHSPARGHRRFLVSLRPAEHVEGVDTKVSWDAEGSRYGFDLPPGDTVVDFRGRLTGSSFAPPVTANLQYLLLESHPLVRPDLTTSARRVGLAETGVASRFRGAQAFLLGTRPEDSTVSWSVSRLETLESAGLALHQLSQVFFLGADGKARGEAILDVDNQGAPTITLPGSAAPTFASIAGEPSFLTNDRDGHLSLPLRQGTQQIVVQNTQDFSRRLGFGLARLELPRPGVPASRAGIQLRYPSAWIPIYESLAPSARWNLLDLDELAALLLLVALAERLLALAGVTRARRWLLALSLAVAAAFLPVLRAASLWALALAWIGLGAALLVQRLPRARRGWALAGGVTALVLIGMVVANVGRTSQFVAFKDELAEGTSDGAERHRADLHGYFRQALGGAAKGGDEWTASPAQAYASEGEAADRESSKAGASTPAAAPPPTAGGYQGLPARMEIPPGARRSSFGRELLATDVPTAVVVVMVDSRVVSAAAATALLVFLALGLLLRRDLLAGFRALVARAHGASPAPST